MLARKLLFFLLISLFAFLMSCATTLSDVQQDLKKQGYDIWYPPESGIQEGQIWRLLAKNRKLLIYTTPEKMVKFVQPSDAQFQTLSKTIDVNSSISAGVSSDLFAETEALSASLKAGTVKQILLDYGTVEIKRIVLGEMCASENLATLPQGYIDSLYRVRGNDQYKLIAAVIISSGLKYTLTCTDTSQLTAQIPKIKQIIKADVDLNIKNNTEASLVIPPDKKLIIGAMLITGDEIELPLPPPKALQN